VINEDSEYLLEIIVNEIKHALKEMKNNKTSDKNQIVIVAFS